MVVSTMEFDMQMRSGTSEPTVLVMGMGMTGVSCARHFAARGIAAEFVDTREQPPGLGGILDAMPDARVHLGEASPKLSESVRRIVISPGVSLNSLLLADARRRGVEVVSDIDLFVAECRAPLLAVTGSNGKSTVASMLGVILNETGKRAVVGGNIGTPVLDLLDPASKDCVLPQVEPAADACVLELSSFQLERSAPLPVTAAVILNVSPDHLDLHGSMDDYAAAKARVYLSCDRAIVNRDEPELAAFVPKGTPVTSFGLSAPQPGEFGLVSTPRGECIAYGDELLLAVDELPLLGRHNVSNAMAALALAMSVGAKPAATAQALRRYQGLPHRMQIVGQFGSATWIDDSKATNVGAALTSIASVEDPFVLIAGGDAKGATFEELAAALRGRDCAVVLLGQDAAAIARDLEGVAEVQVAADMSAAAVQAASMVKPGGSVLLAPACSSLDMFAGFAARGEAFATAAREIDS